MRHLGMVLAAAIVLAACGTGTTADENAVTTPAPASTDTSLPAETTTTTEVSKELTMADFLPGWGASPEDFDAEAEQERFATEQREMQELVADCMADEGFEYIPFVPDEGAFFFGPDLEDNFTETYGFGISTFILEDPFLQEEEEFEDPYANDPNQEIVENLTDAERDEYYYVLWGDEPDFDFENATEEEIDEFFADWQPTGCQSEAEQETYAQQAFFEEFGDAFEEMYTRAEADPRIVAVEQEWSVCMADAGYLFSESQEMFEYLQTKVDEVVTWPEPDFGGDFEEPDFESMTEEEMQAFFEEQEAFYQPQFDEAELKALNDEEIAMAIANEACASDDQDVWLEVMADLEQQFLDENREALEAFLDGS